MVKQANLYIVRVLAQRIVGILLFFIASRWGYGVRPIVYFAMYLVFAVVSLAMVRGVSPSTLAARGNIAANTPLWDKIILAIYWVLAYFAIYILAGLEFAGAPQTLGWVFYAGIALIVASSLLTFWAVRINPFLESTARIQAERGQSVCSSGPYSYIRHPTYAAILIWCAGVSMMFQTTYTAICAGAIALIIILRTALKDRMLIKGLAGYPEYAQRVKYRLIPYIW